MSVEVLNKINEHKVRFVHLQFTDILGMSKSVAVPVETIPRIFNEGLRFDGSSVDAFVRKEETDMYLHPDPSTFRILPWSDAKSPTARMICTVRDISNEPYAGCPRHQLARLQNELEQKGLELMVSSEIEFYLFARDSSGSPVVATKDRVGYFDLAPASPGDETRRAVVLYLQELGIPVTASHHEGSPGQHGVDLDWGELLTTADRIFTTKAVIKRAAILHGLHATFMPRPCEDLGPSSLFLHMKLRKTSKNYFVNTRSPQNLSDSATYFTAGLLELSADFAMLTGQLVNSYKRELPHCVCGESGNVAVRIPPERGENTRLVLRTADPACNPYLVLLCSARAGLWGMHTKHSIPKKLPALPLNLGQAVQLFSGSEFCQHTLGEPLYTNLLTAKQLEWGIYSSSVTNWEAQQYLEKY